MVLELHYIDSPGWPPRTNTYQSYAVLDGVRIPIGRGEVLAVRPGTVRRADELAAGTRRRVQVYETP